MAHYLIRRIQIVLKSLETPREVLLNFDRDPFSMGSDGNELWLLPHSGNDDKM